MPIRFTAPPVPSRDALRASALNLRPAANPTLRTLSRPFPLERVSEEPLEQAFPLFHLGLTDLLNAEIGMRGAKQIGWRYLLDDDMSALVMFDVQRDEHRFASYTRSTLPRLLVEQINTLNDNPRLMSRDVDLSLLEIPALRVTALWLRDNDRNPSNDILVPILSDQPDIAIGRLLSAGEFIQILTPIAQIVLSSKGTT
jgi:hypothetical protein